MPGRHEQPDSRSASATAATIAAPVLPGQRQGSFESSFIEVF
jgi:hypothetical protein